MAGQRLVNLDPDEVSLVDSAANRRKILITRRATPGDSMGTIERAVDLDALRALLETLPADGAEYASLAGAIAALSEDRAEEPAEPAEEVAAAEEPAEEPATELAEEPEEEPVALAETPESEEDPEMERTAVQRAADAGATPELLEIIRSQAAAVDTAKAEASTALGIAREARAEQLLRAAVDKAATDYPDLGEHAKLGKVLRSAKTSLDADSFTALETILRAAQARIADGATYDEVGGTGSDAGGNAVSIFRAKSAALQVANPGMSLGDAHSSVARSEPELYNDYLDQSEGR